MLNPILPRGGSGGVSLTPEDFPEADVVTGVDLVLLAIENEFASASVNKLLQPVTERLDALEGGDSGEEEVDGVIQKNKVFSYTGRIIGDVGAIELTRTMESLGLSAAASFAFTLTGVTGGISVPVQPIDTVNTVFVNVRAALAAKSASTFMNIGLYAGSTLIEVLPANRTVSVVSSNLVAQALGIAGKNAKSYTKSEPLSVNGQLVSSGNGYSSVANDLPELFQKTAALERASGRVISVENSVIALQSTVSEQATIISNLQSNLADVTNRLSTAETTISEQATTIVNIVNRLDALEGKVIESGTPRYSSSTAFITQGLTSASPETE
ncbi:hypothetical protein [Ochrobactrum chromiisoli]|uniref:Uncharacterized protein n=1 Tax=Ochrobactrum chromiisoli TaxID=2993941 RepID=A0ABT3QKW8_9HYPH|nr:hypothetical protein [Ochrobactrum chromiisoli]MCX2696242.1 hypothetical protein [Ochrobactrum chromiisoli]